MRLHAMPQRFIWSGLQTYYDVIQLITDIKDGNNEHIEKDFKLDIFAYPLVAFLLKFLSLLTLITTSKTQRFVCFAAVLHSTDYRRFLNSY